MRWDEICESDNTANEDIKQNLLDILVPLDMTGITKVSLAAIKKQLITSYHGVIPEDDELLDILSTTSMVDKVEPYGNNDVMTIFFRSDVPAAHNEQLKSDDKQADDINKTAKKQAAKMIKTKV